MKFKWIIVSVLMVIALVATACATLIAPPQAAQAELVEFRLMQAL